MLAGVAATPARADVPVYRINAQFLLPNQPPSAWPVHLDGMARDGLTLARSDADWGTAEPQPPAAGARRFVWDRFDTIVTALAKRGLRWLPVVDYATWWSRSLPLIDHGPPADLNALAGYAAALAARYGPGGTFWRAHPELKALPVTALEAWNEPDSDAYWPPRADPARYADRYLATRGAVHSAAPGVQVTWAG